MTPLDFSPDFSKGGGLLPAIVQCAETGEVLMLAHMNAEAFARTLATGEAHYWSRSRKRLWRKGESSGYLQKVRALRLDCDSDSLLLLVDQVGGAACHTGHRSCFYRELRNGEVSECCPVVFNPEEVYP
jgi:phosphoribosyl-AMP cyclohydrolase